MADVLAIFRSRSQAIDCMTKMRALNIPAQLINTPREANVGCGLSLRFTAAAATRAKSLIAKMNYSSFYGYMRLDIKGGKYYFKGF